MNKSEETRFEDDLVQDVLEIITVFSARLYGVIPILIENRSIGQLENSRSWAIVNDLVLIPIQGHLRSLNSEVLKRLIDRFSIRIGIRSRKNQKLLQSLKEAANNV